MSTAAQYNDIRPKSEWKEENEANILNIYLPDFVKEQLKITYVNSTRIIRVTGERQITGNKWNRFNQTFPVPQNCEVHKIQAKFLNGVLTITMPKTTITEAALPQFDSKPTTTQEALLPQKPTSTILEPKEQKDLEEITGKVGTSKEKDGKKVETPTFQEMLEEPKSQKGMDEITEKPSKEKDGKKLEETPTRQEILKEPKPQKGQGDQAPLKDEKSDVKERREGIEQTPREATIRGDQKSFAEHEEEVGKKRKESSMVPPKSDEECSKKRKESLMVGDEKSVPESNKRAMEKVEPSKEDFMARKVKEMKSVATATKDAMRGLALEVSEDRQTMVNIGVAILVIAAVGAYLYYSYRSSRTTKE